MEHLNRWPNSSSVTGFLIEPTSQVSCGDDPASFQSNTGTRDASSGACHQQWRLFSQEVQRRQGDGTLSIESTVETIANVQVTRSGNEMVIVNGTVIDFKDMKLWLNRRYMHQVERIKPGETVRISMGEFWDVWGGGPNPGGLLRWYDPTPVVLLEAQIDETSPLIGFLSIPNENELIKRSN